MDPTPLDIEAIKNCLRLAAEARGTGHTAVEMAALEAARGVCESVKQRARDVAGLGAQRALHESVKGLAIAMGRLDSLRNREGARLLWRENQEQLDDEC